MLFTADIHGNVVQYQKLVDYAREITADVVLIGGDIAPKDLQDSIIISGARKTTCYILLFFQHCQKVFSKIQNCYRNVVKEKTGHESSPSLSETE